MEATADFMSAGGAVILAIPAPARASAARNAPQPATKSVISFKALEDNSSVIFMSAGYDRAHPMNRITRPLLVAATALLAGCAGYAPYNPALEQRVIRMDERTHELLAASRAHAISMADSQSYLRDSLDTLKWLHDDAVEYKSKGPAVEIVTNLQGTFRRLQSRKTALRRADLLQVAGSTSELRAIQFRKRRGYEWQQAHPPTDTSSSTDTDTTTTDPAKCDDKHGHDHGGDAHHGGHDDGDHGGGHHH
jgi:hypothetical protein